MKTERLYQIVITKDGKHYISIYDYTTDNDAISTGMKMIKEYQRGDYNNWFDCHLRYYHDQEVVS